MKIKNIQKKWILFGVATFVTIVGIFETLSKGTSAILTDDLLSISCSDTAYVGTVVNCNIELLSDSMTTHGISAKYNVSPQLGYMDMVESDSWETYGELNYKDLNGFVLLSDGVSSKSAVGTVSYQVPDDAKVGDVYSIGLTDIVIGDGVDSEVNLDNVTSQVTIIEEEVVLSSVNTLENITLSVGNLNETFDKNVNNYTAVVDVEKLVVSVTLTDQKATVTGDVGRNTLYEGHNEIIIYVTSESGITNTYVIDVYRVKRYEPEEYSYNFSSNLTVDNSIKFITHIKNNKTVAYLKNEVTTVGCDVVVYDVENNIKDDSAVLNTGDLLVIYSGNKVIDTYTLSVSGDSNGDGDVDLLDLLAIRRQIVGWIDPNTNNKFNKVGVYYEAIDFNKDKEVDLLDLARMRKTIVGWYDTNE